MRFARPPADSPPPAAAPASGFDTTHWSMVQTAADSGTTAGRDALEALCRLYWPALYVFARRHGFAPADAEDLTQGFFADLLARKAIAQADAARGRFRTFLLASFQNYASHQRARANCRKRGGGCESLSLEALAGAEGQFRAEPATTETPGKLFDRQWALTLIHRALAEVERDYILASKGALFAELKGTLWGGRGEINREETAARLGMTEGALKVARHRLRRRFGEQLRAEVAKTVLDPEEIEAEIHHLLAAFAE